jgi:hypothetical protein
MKSYVPGYTIIQKKNSIRNHRELNSQKYLTTDYAELYLRRGGVILSSLVTIPELKSQSPVGDYKHFGGKNRFHLQGQDW